MRTKYINVRGTNGSGKTTLLRSLATSPDCIVMRCVVPDHKPIPVTYTPDGLAIIGDYTPARAHRSGAGLDCVKTQDASKAVIRLAGTTPHVLPLLWAPNDPPRAVLFEGALVTTIYQGWRDFSVSVGGMTWALLDTPLDVCIARIKERNEKRTTWKRTAPLVEWKVEQKAKDLESCKRKALAAGERVIMLPYLDAVNALRAEIERE